jgi:hypothetical protein
VFRSFQKRHAARKRLGSDNLSRLKWLLAFAQDDDGDAPDLAIEVFAFAAPSDAPIYEPDAPIRSFRELTPERVEDLAAQVRAGINALHAGHGWETATLTLTFAIDDNGRRYYRGDDAADCFLAAAFDLVVAEKARISACALCKRLFVKIKRAEFCSRQCSAKARFARWREHKLGPPGVESEEKFSRWRHERYKAEHPRAKIRRRSSRYSTA